MFLLFVIGIALIAVQLLPHIEETYYTQPATGGQKMGTED